MMQEEEEARGKESLKTWLDGIQQDSWQLELLISGFVIFLLIGGLEPMSEWDYRLNLLMRESLAFVFLIVIFKTMKTAYLALLVCLLLHVLLRGLWIAAVGLRYVSGDIDYEHLRYQPKFKHWLRKRVGTFDEYIERLERYCSVIFSVAFLIIFCFLSLTTFVLFSAALQAGARVLSGGSWFEGNGVDLAGNAIGLVVSILGVIYFLDFVSLGFFKRKQWTQGWYYPIYRFMGWITLSRFYRPLYHNLIDQRFGRRLARLLPVIIIAFMAMVSFNYVGYPYFPYFHRDGDLWVNPSHYDDEHSEPIRSISYVTLRSKYPSDNYLEVFVPYLPNDLDEVLQETHPDMVASREVGVIFRGFLNARDVYKPEADYGAILEAMEGAFRLYLNDSLRTDISPRFHEHLQRQQAGLLYMVPVHDLPVGEHLVRVDRRIVRADSLAWRTGYDMRFYS
jgi:hypothetical protein